MKVKLDWETGDKITVQCLQSHRKFLKKQMKKYEKNPYSETNPNGEWMHPEDADFNRKMIVHLTEVIGYFGIEE